MNEHMPHETRRRHEQAKRSREGVGGAATRTRNRLGFWLWPISFLFLSRERFELFTELKKIRWQQCVEFRHYNPLCLLSPTHFPTDKGGEV